MVCCVQLTSQVKKFKQFCFRSNLLYHFFEFVFIYIYSRENLFIVFYIIYIFNFKLYYSKNKKFFFILFDDKMLILEGALVDMMPPRALLVVPVLGVSFFLFVATMLVPVFIVLVSLSAALVTV